MSNCIDIRNHEVVFTSTEIDIEKLRTIVSNLPSKEEVDPFSLKNKREVRRYYVYWFLNELNVKFSGDRVTIAFRCANSSHTWRDFRGLILEIINPLMKEEKLHRFRVDDEGDPGFRPLVVIFGRNPPF